MALAKLTQAQATFLQTLRAQANDGHITTGQRAELKKELFATIKRRMGIPGHLKLSVEIDDTTSPDYLVLKAKTDSGKFSIRLDDGVYGGLDGAASTPAPNYYKVDLGTAVQYYVDNCANPDRVNIDPGDHDETGLDIDWLEDANDSHIVYVPIN